MSTTAPPSGALQAAFGFGPDVVLSPGPRGARGQIWRLDVGPARYAVKEIFGEPPSEALVSAELAFARRAAEAGVRLPASHPDRQGRYLVPTPDGGWLRLYDWVDLQPVDLTDPATPAALGDLLARLHRCARPSTVEPDGGPPSTWYDRAPTTWPDLTGVAFPWAAGLAEVLGTLPGLRTAIEAADPSGLPDLVECHRDLHPENILVGPDGGLVVIDWDNLGPAAPGRELARLLFDWYCDDHVADLDAMAGVYRAYLRAGGPGAILGPADFSMLLASRLNFLHRQVRVALDPTAEPRHRAWAEREIEEAIRTLPTPGQLVDVLTHCRACHQH